ncbi:MAG TPA: tetratricopeptide repeat protein, partial [Alphaproteobacteria bacterium]|nr:tetratricopeptide repeat protein [Alphaproteobacteria bacterium]
MRAEASAGSQAGHASSSAEAPAGLRPGIGTGRRRILAGLCLGAAFGLGSATTFGAMVLAGRWSVQRASEVPGHARELYVRGSFLWSRRTPDSVAEAIRLLRQAVEIHPAYGEAHAALAIGYILAHRCRAMPGWTALPKAERAARRAIELDPGLDLAQSALAFIEFLWHWDLDASLSRFERALSAHPRSAEMLYWHAGALMLAGRAEVALPLAIRAEEASPDSSAVRNLLARTLFHCGRAADATVQAEEIVARDPGYPWSHETLAVIRLGSGDYKGYLESRGALADRIGFARERELAAAGRKAFAAGGLPAMTEAMIRVETAHYARGTALALDVARALAIA